MTQAKIAVIGLGLIGTSFGLNLTKNKKRNYTVVGYDIERGRERTAAVSYTHLTLPTNREV